MESCSRKLSSHIKRRPLLPSALSPSPTLWTVTSSRSTPRYSTFGDLARCLSALPRYHTTAQQGVDVAHVPGGSTERCFSFWFPPATLVGVEEGVDGRMWVHRAQLIHDKPACNHCCCRAATVQSPRSAVEIIVCSTGSFRKARLRYMLKSSCTTADR